MARIKICVESTQILISVSNWNFFKISALSGVNSDAINQENGGVSSGVTEDHVVSLLTPESISENLLYFISGIINFRPGLRAELYPECHRQSVLPATGRRILLFISSIIPVFEYACVQPVFTRVQRGYGTVPVTVGVVHFWFR